MIAKHLWVPVVGGVATFGLVYWALSRRKTEDVVGYTSFEGPRDFGDFDMGEGVGPVREVKSLPPPAASKPAPPPKLRIATEKPVAKVEEPPIEGSFATMESLPAKDEKDEKTEQEAELVAVTEVQAKLPEKKAMVARPSPAAAIAATVVTTESAPLKDDGKKERGKELPTKRVPIEKTVEKKPSSAPPRYRV